MIETSVFTARGPLRHTAPDNITDYRLSQKQVISVNEMYLTICVEWAVVVLIWRKSIHARRTIFYIFVPIDLDLWPLDLTFVPLITLVQHYVSTKMEVSTAFLSRQSEARAYGRTDTQTDRRGATLNCKMINPINHRQFAALPGPWSNCRTVRTSILYLQTRMWGARCFIEWRKHQPQSSITAWNSSKNIYRNYSPSRRTGVAGSLKSWDENVGKATSEMIIT